ncbi:response regulator [Fundidesulfovibrio terrae]|uniref:response regulator n=1 Tax=Fundidesulfovibrio terrae TaxID=2922866 RepID=UPI001FAF9CE6|nr:response regulator [Fundidesulfovibrio terrae]
MIVEDEVIAAMATERMLKKLGFEVCGNVTSGEEALETMDEECPDLVIMDIRLDGELDGIETSMLMKQNRDVPVIFVTAYSDDSTVSRASAAKPLAFINKPLDITLLQKVLSGITAGGN